MRGLSLWMCSQVSPMRSSAPGREILHQHVAILDQPIEDFLALGMFAVDRDRALAAVEHGEIEAVGALHVAQLAAGDVADARPFHLDHVGAHIGEQLRAGRPRLHVGEVEDFHAVERPARLAPWFCVDWPRQAVAVCGFRRRLLCRLEFHDFLGGFFCRRLGFRFVRLSCALPSFPLLSLTVVDPSSRASRGPVSRSISCAARFAG